VDCALAVLAWHLTAVGGMLYGAVIEMSYLSIGNSLQPWF